MTTADWINGLQLLITALTPILLALIARRQRSASDKVELVRKDLLETNGGIAAKLASLHEEIGGLKEQIKKKEDHNE